MSGFLRERHDPVKLIKWFWPDANIDHIAYDSKMTKGEYDIIKQCGHDGTKLFTYQMMQEALVRLLNMKTHFKPTTPKDWGKVKAIKYTIGPMRHVTVFGMIRLKCSKTSKYPGLVERIRIPVKCEYVY